jgi:hypothetical protein
MWLCCCAVFGGMLYRLANELQQTVLSGWGLRCCSSWKGRGR